MTLLRLSLLLTICAVFTAGCAVSDGGRYGRGVSQQGIAVLGVVSRAQGSGRVYPATLAKELENSIRATARRPVLTRLQVQGAVPHALRQQALASYQKNGTPDPADIQQMAASLPGVRYLVLAAIEDLSTERLPPQYQQLVDANGVTQQDRHTVTLTHSRNVTVSAISIDMVSGRVVRNQMVNGMPSNSRQHTRYLGSSFAGAVATSLTNTLLNGPNASRYPDAPEIGPSVLSLFPAIANALF